jgi:hypothetical protein
MTREVQRRLLWTYDLLLQLYPPTFRRRFAPEMLELAEAAEPGEWLLIFGDTSLAILRSWLDAATMDAKPVSAEPDGYLALGESRLAPMRLVQGLVLSVAIILGACYVSSLPFSYLPVYPDCKASSTENAPR